MASGKPDVSIIIPCRNEAASIRPLLESVVANDFPKTNMEILVVDGMSTDGTRAIIEEFAGQYSFIRLVDNPKKITPAALNTGIAAARGAIIMRMDVHSLYPPDYISRLVEGLERHRADNIGGLIEPEVGDRTWDRAVAFVYTHPFAAGNAHYRSATNNMEPRRVGTVFCGCYRREIFQRIGCFNERLIRTQDREFNDRLIQHGGAIVLDPTIKCRYRLRTGLRGYARWMFRNGFWVFYARRFTQTRMLACRNWVPPLFILWHLAAVACGLLAPAWLPLAAAPIAAYWAINLLVSLHAAWTRREALFFPYLVLLFALTHYLYGVGALCGWTMAKIRGSAVES